MSRMKDKIKKDVRSPRMVGWPPLGYHHVKAATPSLNAHNQSSDAP